MPLLHDKILFPTPHPTRLSELSRSSSAPSSGPLTYRRGLP
ncbi:hypothetical protein [Sporisorium scitamineum]|uniref:Uncharacterized protein n=1 Tax=Sporisorium scitamineum TaxID=49012 RepID=A0A0F7RRH9_9BASI|nr:hypothetical protein [Sporisorium scitamineum]